MSYHESFWLATSAAAPVIALAAVVALPDASAAVYGAMDRVGVTSRPNLKDPVTLKEIRPNGLDWAERLWGKARVISIVSFFNVIIQAGLLAVSLSALASEQNVMPPWGAIIPAVGGILLLAWALAAGATLRRRFQELDRELEWERNPSDE